MPLAGQALSKTMITNLSNNAKSDFAKIKHEEAVITNQNSTFLRYQRLFKKYYYLSKTVHIANKFYALLFIIFVPRSKNGRYIGSVDRKLADNLV